MLGPAGVGVDGVGVDGVGVDGVGADGVGVDGVGVDGVGVDGAGVVGVDVVGVTAFTDVMLMSDVFMLSTPATAALKSVARNPAKVTPSSSTVVVTW